MIEARATATMPVPADEVFEAATDLEHADWLPAVRGLRRLAGSADGVGARYAVEVGLIGRHLSGVLVCRELDPPRRARYVLEEGMDLTITIGVTSTSGGATLELVAAYSVGGGPLSGAVERASAGAARREVARAVEQFAARFGRKAGRVPR
ncbi:MAG TPA: SRPBCC family protein [Candidatus Dormibacteraeota bacterium]|nr:SRPBCC family protein [Candidatus Dormibacteraeota bacterium]